MGLERLNVGRAFAAPLLALLALAAAGCGLGGESVPAASDGAGLVTVRQTTVVRRDAAVGTLRAGGVANFGSGWSRLRTSWTRLGTIPSGRGRQLGIGGVVYVGLPSALHLGKQWLAWTAEDAAGEPRPIGSLGVFFVPDDPVQARGPAGALDELDALGAVPQLLGRGRLGGVETTHYRASVTDVDWVEQMEVELWTDADGFARRLVTTTHRGDATVTTTTDYRPGAAPESRPEPPSARDVVDVSALEARAPAG